MKLRGLAFEVEIPQARPTIVSEFSRQVVEELAKSDLLILPDPHAMDDGIGGDLDDQPWALLRSSLRNDIFTLQVHPTINDTMFGYAEFLKLNKKLSNPTVGDTKPWFFIGERSIIMRVRVLNHIVPAPRWGHILGPVAMFSTPSQPLSGSHPCFGSRVLFLLPRATGSSRDEPLEPGCYDDHCPSDVEVRISSSFHIIGCLPSAAFGPPHTPAAISDYTGAANNPPAAATITCSSALPSFAGAKVSDRFYAR